MARQKVRCALTLNSWQEADDALRQIGENRRDIAAIENVMNERIADAKATADAKARPIREQTALLETALKDFAIAHRADMGKAKSKALTFGKIGFRQSTKLILPRGVEKVKGIIDELLRRGMTECVVYPEPKIDKDALKKYSTTEIADVGAKLEVEDVFGYCGETSKDRFHLTTLMEIEYATRHEKSVVYGCLSYNFQYAAAVAETGVERIILTASQASNIIVGSCVSIGNPSSLSNGNPNLDRYGASMNAKADRVLVTRKEELSDGNVAIYVDNGGKTFDTTTGSFASGGTTYDAPTYISTMPWWTGSTDCVLGPTGSPVSLTSGRYDMRYRYVETFWGNQYSILSDEIHKGDQMYVCDDCTKFATSITEDYEPVGYKLEFTKFSQWAWQSRMGFDPAHPSVMEATACDANSTTGYCSARYINNDTTSVLVFWAGCYLYYGSVGGPRARALHITVANEHCYSSLRLSATGRCGRAASAA